MKGCGKRYTAILCILALCVAALAGCGGAGGEEERIQITIGMWPDESLAKDVALFMQWKEAFEADYPQYEIVGQGYTYNPDTFLAKATSKTLPVIFQTYFTEPQKLIANGFIRDITDQLTELGWYDKMDETMRETVSADGKVYGVPRDGYGLGLFLNLAMLYDVGVIDKAADGTYILYDESGKPLYPTTFDEIYEVSQLIVEGFDGAYGMVILSADKNGGWQFANMAWNFGCEALQVQNSDGTWSANLNDPGAVAALEWIQKMRQEELISPDTSLSYADWYQKIGSGQAAMAFAGSDAITLPVTNFNFNKDDIAFVPMPTGDGQSHDSLFGGTPFVFAENATDEQVKGALLFLKYMGRSPETDETAKEAMRSGYELAQAKGMPILPDIRPWVNEDFKEMSGAMEAEFVNVNLAYFKDFYDTIAERKKGEEPYFCQDMYALLDNALQAVLSDPYTANAESLLITANNQFQSNFMTKVK